MQLRLDVAALALAVFCTTGCVSIRDGGGGSRALQSKSPSGRGTAIFTKTVGPQDSAVSFEVIDPKVSAKPINIGFVGDANWKVQLPKNAVWSADGSVVAVRGADYKSWSHAHDFTKHSDSLNDVYPLDKRADSIEKLLKSRGGKGPKVLDDWAKFDQVARPVANAN